MIEKYGLLVYIEIFHLFKGQGQECYPGPRDSSNQIQVLLPSPEPETMTSAAINVMAVTHDGTFGVWETSY